jgi:hypothetical protein
MRSIVRVAAIICFAYGTLGVSSNAVFGQSPEIFIGPQIGLLGLGASAEVSFGTLSVSGEFGYVPVSQVTLDEDDIEYDIDTDFYGGALMVNYRPGGSRFSIGGGLLLGGYNASGLATDIVDDIEIGDNIYTMAEVGDIRAAIDYSGPAPAIMVGLRGAGLNVGVGVAFTGSPEFTLSATGTEQNSQQFIQDLNTETDAVQDELDILPVLPMFRIGWQFGI